jgi:transcriptional regulator GlxA family with amidase domain
VKIAMLAYPGCLGSELLGMSDSLLVAERLSLAFLKDARVRFDLRMVGVAGRSVLAAGGIRLGLQAAHRRPDLLVVPGLDFSRMADLGARLETLNPQSRYIAAAFRRGIPVAAICGGAFLLGQAGLLDGRRAATAWLFAEELARRYPAAQVEPEAMFVEDSGVITTGAFSSGFDLAVHLLRQGGNLKLAQMISRTTFLDAQRKSQAPFADASLLDRSRGAFSDAVKDWLRQHLSEPYRLPRLARAFRISPRTLLRRFKAESAESPLSYLRRMRIEAAKHLLVTTALSVSTISAQVGYEDASTFVRMFSGRVGHTPARYRQRFREV